MNLKNQKINCRDCGEAVQLNFDEATVIKLIAKGICFSCEFWLNHIEMVDDSNSVRFDGALFFIGNELDSQNQAFDGKRFKVEFMDGRTVETNSLWFCGKIPNKYKSKLPNNAFSVKE